MDRKSLWASRAIVCATTLLLVLGFATLSSASPSAATLRYCQDESVFLERVRRQLGGDRNGLRSDSSTIEFERSMLNNTMSTLAMANEFSRGYLQSQARSQQQQLQEHIRVHNLDADRLDSDEKAFNVRNDRWNNRCANLELTDSEVEDLCESAHDPFCKGFRR